MRPVGHIISSVFHAGDATTAVVMYHAACEMLEGCCPRAERVLEEAEPDALAYLDFPTSHWKRLRTNNVQERTNREIKRRSRVVQVFPSEKSLSGSWAPSCATRLRHGPTRTISRRGRWPRCTTRSFGRAPRAVMTGLSWKRPPGRWSNPALGLPTGWIRPRISIDSGFWTQGPISP